MTFKLQKQQITKKKNPQTLEYAIETPSYISFKSQSIEEIIDPEVKVLQLLMRESLSQNEEIPITWESEFVLDILNQAEKVFKREPNILSVTSPCIVFGDIHGQLRDLLRIFFMVGSPLEGDKPTQNFDQYTFLFLGDYVDRGPNSVEVILLLYSLQILYPSKFFFIRGNHEDQMVAFNYGFLKETLKKFKDPNPDADYYDNPVFKRFVGVFQYLPLAAIIDDTYFCVHGGIGEKFLSLKDLKNIKRPIVINQNPENDKEEAVLSALWADPFDDEDDEVSEDKTGHPQYMKGGRGQGISSFNYKALEEFLTRNRFQMLIRAHQLVNEGYQFFGNNRGLTIFSAPNYTGQMNAGAVLEIGQDKKLYVHTIQPHVDQETKQ